MSRRRFSAMVLFPLALSIGASACGGSNGESGADTTVVAAATETSAAVADTVAAVADTVAAAVGAAASPARESKEFCAIVKEADKDEEFNNLLQGEAAPSKEDIETVGAVYRKMSAAAPAEIKAEMQAASDFINNDLIKIAGLDTATTDPTKQAEIMKVLTPLMAKMTALEAQMKKVSEYSAKNCGVSLD
jgi:hypothetical protein